MEKENLKKEMIEKHRHMWNWIADKWENGINVTKADYLKEHNIPSEKVFCNCFCCQYTLMVQDENCIDRCIHCPVLWNPQREKVAQRCTSSLYYEIRGYATGLSYTANPFQLKECARLARQIAELPERTGV